MLFLCIYKKSNITGYKDNEPIFHETIRIGLYEANNEKDAKYRMAEELVKYKSLLLPEKSFDKMMNDILECIASQTINGESILLQ